MVLLLGDKIPDPSRLFCQLALRVKVQGEGSMFSSSSISLSSSSCALVGKATSVKSHRWTWEDIVCDWEDGGVVCDWVRGRMKF